MWKVTPGHKYSCEFLRLPYVQLPMLAVIDIMHLFRNLIDDLYNVLRTHFDITDNDQQCLVTTFRSMQHFPTVLQYMTHDFYEVTEKISTKEIIMQFVFFFPSLARHIHISDDAKNLVHSLAALMYLLLMDEIEERSLQYAEKLVTNFFRLWLRHAGPRYCSATKHALLHVIEMVRYHGPLIHLAAFKDESNIVCLNRRVHHGMRVPAVLHNNIEHAAGAKHFFHDMLLKLPIAANFRREIRELGPRRHSKVIQKYVGDTGFISHVPIQNITRHSVAELRKPLYQLVTDGSRLTWSFFKSFVIHDRCEFLTAQDCSSRTGKFKDCFVVDTTGTFWELQYAFYTKEDGHDYAGVLGYKITPTDIWCPFPSAAQNTCFARFCVKGKRERKLSTTGTASIRYYALNVSSVMDSTGDLFLMTVPFCTTLS